jgi:hypothetical protein
MISIPPQLLASLVLGYRSRDELAPHAPDLRVWGRGQVWCDVLFPKMEAWIDTIY